MGKGKSKGEPTGKGKFKGKPTGQRTFSAYEEIANRPDNFKKKQVEKEAHDRRGEEDVGKIKHKGTEGLIEIENPNLVNPNLVKPKNIKAKNIEEELEKQKSHVRYVNLRMEGKTEQARNDLERLALIRQQRADAAKRCDEEKAAKEARKAEGRQ